jgi:hypothetical protein
MKVNRDAAITQHSTQFCSTGSINPAAILIDLTPVCDIASVGKRRGEKF